jgi:hypothetical protein
VSDAALAAFAALRGQLAKAVIGQPAVIEALLFAPAHNLMRTVALAPQLLGLGTTPSAAGVGTV